MTNEELYELLSKRMDNIEERLETFRSETNERFTFLERETNERFTALEKDVSWIRGMIEGEAKSGSETRSRRAIWVATISAAIALASLITGFFI